MEKMESANTMGLSTILFGTDYRTGRSDPALEFYKPCLLNSRAYDRAVGYFRSTIYLVVGPEMIEFAKRGGKVRLICSPALYEEDTKSIEEGYSERLDKVSKALDQEIDQMMQSAEGEYRTKVLATLVGVGALDIKVAFRPPPQGIYHEKIGVFRDEFDNTVSFIGSANETWSAWHERGNFEVIEVFCSWKGGRERERVLRHQSDFEKVWFGEAPGIQIASFPEASKNKLLLLAHESLSDIDSSFFERKFSKARSPQPHQLTAIEEWERRGRRGILEHATGSGKTFTALTATKKYVENGFPALILVPSKLLLEQWTEEIKQEIPEAVLFLAGAGNDSWKNGTKLKGMTANDPMLGARIVLATMQTAASDGFRGRITQGSHLMMVADEVHQLGSEYNSQSLSIDTGPRLGLSATPRRYGDEAGTQKLIDYFAGVIPPPVTLQDAIAAGRLVEYEYHPHAVVLTAEESQNWSDFSEQISKEIAQGKKDDSGQKIISDRAKLLLIQRSRVAKKAQNKIALCSRILKEEYEEGQRWLIYCEDSGQLREVMNVLVAKGMRPIEYHSAMEGDRHAALEWFKIFGGIIVSIKCLDEGVDIPSVDHALILASSQNPRQFIQRRGRVLRKSQGKSIAAIHDAIVVPLSLDHEPDQFSLLRCEIVRAIEFAKSGLNKSAGAELRGIAVHLGVNPDELIEDGIEDEE
jgi:superfamily II DNA or RNA helicase